MPQLAIWGLLALGAGIAAFGTPRQSFTALAVTWLLVPGLARPPGSDGHLFVHRVIIAAALIGLLRGAVQRRIDREVFAPRGVHVALGAYLAVVLVVGVVFAQPTIPVQLNVDPYLVLLEGAAFFVTALALVRTVGVRFSAATISVVAGITAGVALIERMYAWSYGRWITSALADPSGLLSLPLQVRGSDVRVRVAALFALELGWICALVLPLAIAVALTRRSALWWASPAALTVAMVLTWSRSPYLGLAAGLAVLAVAVLAHAPRRFPLVAGVFVAGALVLLPTLQSTLQRAEGRADQDIRFERLPQILGLAADRPAVGLGLGGLVNENIRVVDISWVSTYVSLGVVGLVALAALLLMILLSALRFVFADASDLRLVAAGATGGLVALPLALAAYDFEHVRSSTETMWMLTAVVVAANERLGVFPTSVARLPGPTTLRRAAAGAGVGLLLGFALTSQTAERHTGRFLFSQAAPALALEGSERNADRVLGRSACDAIAATPVTVPVTVRCRTDDRIPGAFGTVRIEAASPERVRAAFTALDRHLMSVFPAWTTYGVEEGRGRPAWATTAPIWGAALGGALGLVPVRRPTGRRRRRGRSDGDGMPVDRAQQAAARPEATTLR